MKLFGRDKNENKDNEEKPIVFYYAKYIGVLGSDKSRPVDEDSYVYIFRIHLKNLLRTICLALNVPIHL